MKKRYKRRNFFIKNDLQGKYILGYFLFVMGGGLLFIALLVFFSSDTLTITYTGNDLQFGQTPLILLRQILTAHWIFLVIGGLIVVLLAMLMTHRIAGPMFRLERGLDNMLARKLNDTIFLRSKDEGKELAAKLNSFNAELSASLKEISTCALELQDLLQHSHQTQEAGGSQEEALRKCQRIVEICSSYELKDDA